MGGRSGGHAGRPGRRGARRRRSVARRAPALPALLARDGVQQPRHRLVGPVFGIAVDLRVAACARRVVDPAPVAEVVPELLDLLGADVVGAPALFLAHLSSPIVIIVLQRLHARRRLLFAPHPAVKKKADQSRERHADEDDEPRFVHDATMKKAIIAVLAALAAICQAQDYPSRPVRILVGFTPGGGPDLTARHLAQKLTEAWGQQVIVENRPGAGGTLAAATAARAAPDGYTLLSVSSAHAAAAAIYPKLGYDTLKDLSGITQTGTSKYVLVSAQFKTLQELLAAAKAKPGQLNFSSAGVGSGTHFAGEI